MNVLTVKIPKELDREINRAARRERISKSELARRAMVRYVTRRDMAPKLRTAAEVAGDLIGSVRGTPPDLSSDPRYLQDLGR
jgi:metal-responsive CopG/Arc/MetJ family transcriptional regulator